MKVLLNVISVIFLSFSITSSPIEEEYQDDDTSDSFQPVLEAHGSPKDKSGNVSLQRNNTFFMNHGEMNIGDSTPIGLGRSGLRNKSMLWPNGIIHMSVEGSYNTEQRELIILAMDTLDYWTCIRFAPYNGEKDYIAIVNTPNKGCSSPVGYQGGRQEITLEAPKCFDKVGTVLHQMLHTIGLIDEHRRPDRHLYVFVHIDNVMDGEAEHFRKYTNDYAYDYGIPYDFNSVMHYPENAYSKNGLLTIEPAMPSEKIGQRDGMSVRDALKVAIMYQCFYEIDTTLNYSKILPLANETLFSKDYLAVLYFNEKMNRN